jgi:hypothetical protein
LERNYRTREAEHDQALLDITEMERSLVEGAVWDGYTALRRVEGKYPFNLKGLTFAR